MAVAARGPGPILTGDRSFSTVIVSRSETPTTVPEKSEGGDDKMNAIRARGSKIVG